jgi:hypothetical protein
MAMKPRDQHGIATRRAVAGRLRTFFAQLTTQFASGTSEMWDRVQRILSERATTGEPPPPAPPDTTQSQARQTQPGSLKPRGQPDKR